jgi:hypothetical protein
MYMHGRIQGCHDKEAFKRKKIIFASKLDLNLRKKLVKCYIWSTLLYGAESWTLWKVDEKYVGSFETWCRKIIEKMIWTNSVRNEKVFQSQGQKKCPK